MSLGAELVFAFLAKEIAPVVYLSRNGQGAPLLDEVLSPWRLSVRPLGGFRRFGESFAGLSEPVSLIDEPDRSKTLVAGKRLLVDCVAGDVFSLLGRAAQATEGGAAAIRVRGAFEAELPEDFVKIWACPSGREYVSVKAEFATDRVQNFTRDLQAGNVDEFDQFRAFSQAQKRVKFVRHRASFAEAHFHPVVALDQPDNRQHDLALGEDRLVFAEDNLCALVLPQFAAQPAPVGCVVDNVPFDAPDPRLRFDEADEWRVEHRRRRNKWVAVAYPQTDEASVIVTLDIEAKHAPQAEITELWSGLTRNRGDWEEWDEADAQLKLEESW